MSIFSGESEPKKEVNPTVWNRTLKLVEHPVEDAGHNKSVARCTPPKELPIFRMEENEKSQGSFQGIQLQWAYG